MNNDKVKWDNYYNNDKTPPWESSLPFHGLLKALNDYNLLPDKYRNVIELGSGILIKIIITIIFIIVIVFLLLLLLFFVIIFIFIMHLGRSQSAIYLASQSYNVTAIDFCNQAINDAKLLSNKVNWICGDILDDNLFNNIISKESYDIVFDMQCFHVLKHINENRSSEVIYNCLRKGGYALIVVGAKLDETIEQTKPGPVLLSRNELITPFVKVGLELVSIELSTFNETDYYLTLDNIPSCYIGIFKKS